MPEIRKEDLFCYQKECLNELEINFTEKERQRGLVSIPTGGGKTIIAVKFILNQFVEKDYRVLWLCNRSELLKQARENFISNSDIIDTSFLNDMILIAAQESSWKEVKEEDKVIFSTDKSTKKYREHLQLMVRQTNTGIITVIDEAHHSVAPTYLEIINDLFQCARANNIDIKLLGLTATPYRMNGDKTQELMKLYDDFYDIETLEPQNGRETFNSIIYRALMNELIAQNILANPVTIDYETRIELENELSEEEIEELNTGRDLASRALNEIGKNKLRNEKIVEEYKKNKDKYGKTIVYATDINHCKTLVEEFNDNNVEAEYVTHEISEEEFNNITESFKKKGSPKVLINVLKLTEGFDAPQVKTIFLARPTESEVLFRQMIGRGMRGPRVGGTKDVYLVTFVDTWSNFNPVKSSEVIRSEEDPPSTSILDNTASRSPGDADYGETEERLTKELLIAAYNKVKEKSSVETVNYYKSAPESWFYWQKPIYDDKLDEITSHQDKYILIFNNQSSYYKALSDTIKNNLDNLTENINQGLISTIFDGIFAECPGPLPKKQDIKELIKAIQDENIEIKYYEYQKREEYNPRILAKEIYKNDLGPKAQAKKLRGVYDKYPGCQSIFNTFGDFRGEVETEIHKLIDKNVAAKIEIPEEDLKELSREEHFDALTLIARNFTHGDILPRIKTNMLSKTISKKKYERITQIRDNELMIALDQNLDEDTLDEDTLDGVTLDGVVANAGFCYKGFFSLKERENSLLSSSKKRKLSSYNKKNQKVMFPRGVPEYNEVKFSEKEVKYFGIFHSGSKNIIINKLLNSADIPLFVLEYVIYKQLLKADMAEVSDRERFYKRLKRFRPTVIAIIEAKEKGFSKSENVMNYWYAVSSQFLNSLHRIYDLSL